MFICEGVPATARNSHSPPGPGLLDVSAVDQRVERERSVSYPAVAIVPVADAANFLGQRGGGGCQDASRRRIGEGLQRNQRPHHGLAPWASIDAPPGPLPPPLLGVANRLLRVDSLRAAARGRDATSAQMAPAAPADTENSATVVKFSPRSGHVSVHEKAVRAGHRAKARPQCGGPTARSNRSQSGSPVASASAICPRRPTTMRIRSGSRLRGGIQSITVASSFVGLVVGLENQRPFAVPARACAAPRPQGATASGRAQAYRATPRNTRENRNAASRASRSNRCVPPAPPSGNRRSGRSLQSSASCCPSFGRLNAGHSDDCFALAAGAVWEGERISRFQGVVFSVFVPPGASV